MKQTYVISFYPGMVLPKPYFVTTEETTDYGAIMDILADKLAAAGSEGLFDDDYKLSDDQVLVCGNNGRRLITGGMLTIEEMKVDIPTVTDYLEVEANTTTPYGNVRIGFVNDGNDDETELSGFSVEEIAEVWIDFCSENNLSPFDILYVERNYGGIQYQTERGLVYVVGECTEDEAKDHDFSYAFSDRGRKLYSKIVGPNRRQFVLIE